MTRWRWGVIGVGTAGRARARAVLAHPQCALVGVHRGRYAEQIEAPRFEDADALIAACDVVAICSPDATHPAWVERALAAGRHVVVEYPLAADAVEGARLFALAHAAGRVLHVEHIELLAPTTRFMVEHAARRGPGSMWFRSSGPPHPNAAAHALTQLARLHRWRQVGGPIEGIRTDRADGQAIDATLRFCSGWEVELHARREPDGTRGIEWTVAAAAGEARVSDRSCFLNGEPVAVGQGPSLFYEDTAAAVERLAGRPAYVDEARVLWGLRAVSALAAEGCTALVGTS